MDTAIFNISDLEDLEIDVIASQYSNCVDVSAKGLMKLKGSLEEQTVRFHVARIPKSHLSDFIAKLQKFKEV